MARKLMLSMIVLGGAFVSTALQAESCQGQQAKAPAQTIAAHQTAGKVDRTRPLCPYPQVAHYNGSGNIDDALNFSCREK